MDTAQQLRHDADRLIELHEVGDLEGVLALADEVSAKASSFDSSDEVVRESLFIARFQRAMALTEQQEFLEAADAYRDAAAVPTDPEDPDQRHEVAMALLHRGMCLDAIEESREAVAAYDEVIERFAGAPDPVTQDQVVRARTNRAAGSLALGQVDAALAAAEDLVAELDPHAPLSAEQWILASRIRAAALVELGREGGAREALALALTCHLDDPAVVEQRMLAEDDLLALGDDTGPDASSTTTVEP